MIYNDAIKWVHSLPRFAKSPGIDNTKTLLKRLGSPEKALKFVHVAGTNGKGSVTMMTSHILTEAGYKVGSTISPFVVNFKERFLINCKMASEEQVAKALTAVKNVINENDSIVEFDAVTAAAVILFSWEKCDIVCLETGLGGRLDSSNAVQNTLVSCITAIGKDHTEYLGEKLSEIAAEKCGIFKNNCDVVAYPMQEESALATIKLEAKKAGCSLTVPSLAQLAFCENGAIKSSLPALASSLPTSKSADTCKCITNEKSNKSGKNNKKTSLLCGSDVIYKGCSLKVPFAGVHQVYNAVTAFEVAVLLREHGFTIDENSITNGIKQTKFPARIEIMSEKPLVIIDGSHNPQGARALAATLKRAGCEKLVGVIGVLKNKGEREMMSVLCPLFQSIYTVCPDEKRGLSAHELANVANEFCADVTPCEDVQSALQAAKKHAKKQGAGLVICGSLYLAAQARD